ncbi:MAG: ClbS/DfsB family four-helix bundle protein [Anaerolineales bacterium]|nr:MAG: ClbS/DfsB family four-helix bundle protein [Anaerolineales bacterium]
MSYKQRTLDFLEIEWKTYIERFHRLPAEDGMKRVKAQGYERFRDMLAHILSWWEEAMPIILAIAENREYERRKYDFDAFNAGAVAKYGDWDETEFLAHFEKTRQKAAADLRSMQEAVFENRRVRAWINGVFIHHAREHLVALSKFLTLDTLEHEWETYAAKFDALEKKDEFLKKQDAARFADLLAHAVAWWEEGVAAVKGALKDPAFVYGGPADTDAYNAEIVAKYQGMSEAEVRALFERTRLEMIELVRGLPEGAFEHPAIEEWLAADVVEHFDEHAAKE